MDKEQRFEERVRLDEQQFKSLVKEIHDATTDNGKWLSTINTTITAANEDVLRQLTAINDSINAGFKSVADAITATHAPTSTLQMEVLMSFIVPDNQADTTYALTLGAVTDSEGNVVPTPALTITVTSDNPDAVAVTPDADPSTGSVHFGNPGNATITANVTGPTGLLGTGVAGFVVTTGDPAAIAGVALGFAGLTETPPTP